MQICSQHVFFVSRRLNTWYIYIYWAGFLRGLTPVETVEQLEGD